MKVDAICKDKHGNEATVVVDLDYVNVSSYDDIKNWCENELEDRRHCFDVLDFSVTNYDDITSENIIEDDGNEGYCLDPLSTEEIS